MQAEPKHKIGKKQKFTPPKPMELAKLAAMLARPVSNPAAAQQEMEHAFERAMEFYVEAVCFLGELPSDWDTILARFGTDERNREGMAEAWEKELRFNRLKLEPSKFGDDADEVRKFLKENGLNFKEARYVLRHFKKSWEANREANPNRHQSADSFIASIESTENGQKIYRFPQRTLEGVVTREKQRRSESKQKSWLTRKKSPVK